MADLQAIYIIQFSNAPIEKEILYEKQPISSFAISPLNQFSQKQPIVIPAFQQPIYVPPIQKTLISEPETLLNTTKFTIYYILKDVPDAEQFLNNEFKQYNIIHWNDSNEKPVDNSLCLYFLKLDARVDYTELPTTINNYRKQFNGKNVFY
jgi:hypothetical protein